LSNVKNVEELKQIYRNVGQQNRTLREDTHALKQKVDLLMEKQKAKQSYVSQEDASRDKELQTHQQELKDQYRIMQELKKRKEQSQATKGT
jgi:D-alanine-D-alanine ligase-like ATP-grasp enzyme